MSINAGIDTVIVRDDRSNYRVYPVAESWVQEDESLEGTRGY